MSTQAYYKDRLGFDPNEALNDGSTFDKSQQGYEENLSKFKGLWDLFIDSSGGTSYLIFKSFTSTFDFDTNCFSLIFELSLILKLDLSGSLVCTAL